MKNKKIIHLGISSFNTKGRGLQKQGTKAFTLVELIVAVTILAILGTIGFISYTGYVSDARDTSRLGALENMRSALTLYRGAHSVYPKPTDSEEITYSGETVWYQGTFGDSVLNRVGGEIDMRELPTDPLTGNEYTYSITNNKKEFQIAAVFEGEQASIINKNVVHASGEYGYTKLVGDYNGKVIKVGNCSNLKIVASPSIIKGDTDKTELKEILDEKKLVYNNGKVLPSSYASATRFTEELPGLPIVNISSIETFEGTCRDLKDESKQQEFITNLAQAFDGTIVEEVNEAIEKIVEKPTLFTAQTIINSNINPTIKVTAEDILFKCAINQDPNVEVTFDDTYKDDTSIYGTGFYVQSNTCLKWQAQSGPVGLKWASGSTDSGDDNYIGNYPEPVWDGSKYIYNPPNLGLDTDYQAFKYCESIGDHHWRLPTRNELFSIMTYESGDTNSSGKFIKLPSITQDYYWSSIADDDYSFGVWGGFFYDKSITNYYKNDRFVKVICVHD